MTNYDLEENKLLYTQAILSVIFIFTTVISITLTYNEILTHLHKKNIYDNKTQKNILKINRVIVFLVAIGFLVINIRDKNVKKKYGNCNEWSANLQIDASFINLIATFIVLYIAFNGDNITDQNPEL